MIKLSERLAAVAGLVCPGAAVADVGTDHGLLPVWLALNNVIKSAVACDINEAPLASCRRLVEEYSLTDVIETRLCDGLDGVASSRYDTVIIAGMGGELIADILSRCDCINEKHVILQPMTHAEVARKFLYDNGFEIESDIIVRDGSHYYNVFDARFCGHKAEKSRVDYYLGNISDFSHREYFSHLLKFFYNKSKSGEDFSDIISALEKIV